MIVRFRLGNITETRPVHGKLDHHVSAGRKRDGFKQLHVSVEFTKYGNTLFRPVQLVHSVLSCFSCPSYSVAKTGASRTFAIYNRRLGAERDFAKLICVLGLTFHLTWIPVMVSE